jgi:tripeptide aminopeptidase
MSNPTESPQPDTSGLDLDRAFKMVMELMAIPGKGGQEAPVAEYIRDKLRKAGAPASAIETDSAHLRTPVRGEVGNMVLKLPGTMRGPRRMMSAHMDTVPICVGSKPVLKGRTVRSADPNTGLGADDRAGCAVVLTAALEILERKLPHPPLTFCWFIQEEGGLNGARFIKKSMLGKPKLAFNWDGGSPFKLTVGATGGYHMQADVEGIASHAGVNPEGGVSAIAIASLAIADLHRNGWHGDIQKGRKRGTSNVGFIHGGEATNVVTDRVAVKAEARSHDPKFRQRIVSEIEKAFRRAAKEVKNADRKTGTVTITGRLSYESFLLKDNEPCIEVAEQAIRSLGHEPIRAVANGGLDANWLYKHGIPAVSIGCGQADQHKTSETLDVDGFEDACRIALRLVTASDESLTRN